MAMNARLSIVALVFVAVSSVAAVDSETHRFSVPAHGELK